MPRKKATATVSKNDLYDRLKKRLNKARTVVGKTRYWTPEQGSNIIRPVLFEHDGQEELFIIEAKHWLPGNKPVWCVDPWGEDCPVCAAVETLDREVSRKYRAKKQYVLNVVLRDENNRNNEELVVASLTPTAFEAIQTEIETGALGEDTFSLDKGRDWVVSKTGTGLQTKYHTVPASRKSRVKLKEKPLDLLDMADNRRVPSEAELEAIADQLRGE